MPPRRRTQSPVAPPAPAARRTPAARSRGGAGGILVTVVLVLLSALLLGHGLIPNGSGLGSLWETFMPWAGVPMLVCALVALLLRSRAALIASVVAAVSWSALFGSTALPHAPGEGRDLRVVSHNVYAANTDPAGTAAALKATDADVIAVEEATDDTLPALQSALDPGYRYQQLRGTVGVWSRFPVRDARPVDVGMGWVRALRMTIATPKGDVAFYVVHLASIRLGADGLASQRRDDTMAALSRAITADPAARLVLAGDLNTAGTDRSLSALTGHVSEAEKGFGFTWPAGFPMVRLDHVLSRGLTVTGTKVLDSTGSDHRPVQADFTL